MTASSPKFERRCGTNANDDENQCPNSRTLPLSRQRAILSPAARPRKANDKSPKIAKLAAKFSQTNPLPRNQKEDLLERENRRMQMLQERRVQQVVLKQQSVGSIPPAQSVDKSKKTNLKEGQGIIKTSERKYDVLAAAVQNECIQVPARTSECVGNEAAQITPLKDSNLPPSVESEGQSACPEKATVQTSFGRRCAQITTLVSRLILLGLALYEVQHHCPTTSNAIQSSLRIAKIYFNRIQPVTSACLEASWNLSKTLLPQICWCLETWSSMKLHVLREKTSGALYLYHYAMDRIVGRTASWEDILHMYFVAVFLIRCFIVSLKLAFVRFNSTNVDKNNGHGYARIFLFLASIISCWMIMLPLFNEGDKANQFYFFARTTSKRLKREIVHVTLISNPRYSLADIMAIKFYQKTFLLIKSKIKVQLRKEIHRALTSPFKFHGRIQKLLTIVRWAKFLAPLVGTCNKLRGHYLDMIRKRRQHRTSKAAQMRWREVMLAILKQSKLERAVLQLQKSFREKRENKAKRRFELMSPDRSTTVSKKIRRTLLEEQTLARSKLEKIEEIDNHRKMRRQVSEIERSNITKYKEMSRKQKKRLLLSPKTSFAVGWKCVAIICVALELSQIFFAPMLSGEMTKMPLDKFLSKVLFATGCKEKAKKAFAPSIFIPVLSDLGTANLCTTSSLKQTWLVTVRIIATILVPTVNAICFLDGKPASSFYMLYIYICC